MATARQFNIVWVCFGRCCRPFARRSGRILLVLVALDFYLERVVANYTARHFGDFGTRFVV